MNNRLRYLVIVLTWVAYFIWAQYSDGYFEPFAYYILGAAATSVQMIGLWFYWQTVPFALAFIITLLACL